MKQATVLAIGEKEKTLAAYVVPQGEAFCVTDHRNPALPQAWHTLAGTLPCCAISPEISAEQVADFLQHRLLKLKPGHTAGADPLPDELTRYPAALAGRGGTLVSISGDTTATEARC